MKQLKQDSLGQLESLEQLAARLACNNVNISLWDLIDKNRDANQVYEGVLTDSGSARQAKSLRERNIVIVGAGASKNACAKLPTGAEASEGIRGVFEGKGEKGLLENEIKRLEQVYRLPPGDFETILYAISRFYPKDLKKELFERYDCRYHPNLTYEILAHLLKHRFIDVIINFNFDELLDQAIADELNPGEYQLIISDGEYDEALMFDDDGLRYPVYIKPHGSVSHKSSMRFTREDYFGLPADIEEAIKKLINPNLGKVRDSDKAITVNFIVVGFNMQSFEFNLLLNESFFKEKAKEATGADAQKPSPKQTKSKGKPKVHFFFFQTTIKDEFFKGKEFPGDLKKGIEDNATWIEVPREKEEKQALDRLFKELWERIEKQFTAIYKPRNIARHELIAKIFESEERRKGDKIFNYLHDRTLLEFALSLAKYKGFVSIDQLASDRFGKYFNLLQRSAKSNNENKEKLKYYTIPDYCSLFELTDFGYGRTAFYWANDKTNSKENLTKSPENFMEKFFPYYYDKLLNNMLEPARLIKHRDFFKKTMKTLVFEEDIEISPVYENLYQNIFREPKPVKTKLALDYYTRHFLYGGGYDKILIVAETGEWLLNLVDEKTQNELPQDKAYHLIIADAVKKPAETLPSKVKSPKEKVVVDVLHWWMHNQHMTIFLRRDAAEPDKWNPLWGIYFDRRQRNTHINPVILDTWPDLEIIIGSFGAYHEKSQDGFSGEVSPEAIQKYLESFKPRG